MSIDPSVKDRFIQYTLALKPEEKEVIFSQPADIHQLIRESGAVTSNWHA